MTTTVDLEGALTGHVGAVIDTSRQGYGFFWDARDARRHNIWIGQGRRVSAHAFDAITICQ